GGTVAPIGAHVRRIFGPDVNHWRAYDPAVLAAKLKDGQLALYIDCGTEDGFKLQTSAQYLHDVLERAGVRHAFTLAPGRHDFAFWSVRIGESLKFFAEYFNHSAAALRPAA